jgi:hypothetical protein
VYVAQQVKPLQDLEHGYSYSEYGRVIELLSVLNEEGVDICVEFCNHHVIQREVLQVPMSKHPRKT